MLPLTDITQLAIKVQQASQERENTAVRVGTAILELVKFVKALPDTRSFRFDASQNSLDLVINVDAEDGQSTTTSVNIPVLTDKKAGIVTPGFITLFKNSLTEELQTKWREDDDFFKKDVGQAFNDFVTNQQLNFAQALAAMKTQSDQEREQVQLLFDAIAKGKIEDGVYYLGTYVSDEVMANLQSSFPMLEIHQPEYTLIKYHDAVKDGTFASNMDNRTGYESGKAYAPSGHVSKILAARERVILHKGSDGVKRYARLNQDNPALSLAGESIDYTGNRGWSMMLEPNYWYKGINDIINKEHYAAFAFGACPPNPKGKKLEGATIANSKIAGYAYASVSNYDIDTLEAHKVQDSGFMTINIEVEGYHYVRFPFARLGKEYGHLFLDANRHKVGHTLVDAIEDTWEGCYLIYPIPAGATTMHLTYPAGFAFNDFIWLTESDKIEDCEPDWVHHPKRFVSATGCGYTNPTNVAGQTFDRAQDVAYIGTGTGLTNSKYGTVSKNVLDTYETRLQGFDFSSYEDFKDMMQLYYARYGKRNAEGTFTTGNGYGITNLFTLPVDSWTEFKNFNEQNITHLPDGTTQKTGRSMFMGYFFGSSFNAFTFLDTSVTFKGVIAGKRRSATGRTIPYPISDGTTAHTVKTHTNGKFLDITPAIASTAIATTDFYAAYSGAKSKLFGEVLALCSTSYTKTHIGNSQLGNANIFLALSGGFLNCDGDGVFEMNRYEHILV